MAFNIMDLMNATTKAAAGENNEYQEITLGIRDIVVTKHNKYSMDGLKDLAAGNGRVAGTTCFRADKRGILAYFWTPPHGRIKYSCDRGERSL